MKQTADQILAKHSKDYKIALEAGRKNHVVILAREAKEAMAEFAEQNETPESQNYPTAGLLGHYGPDLSTGSEEYNRGVGIANAQVDFYNSFVYKLPRKFQMEYQERTVEMCRIILRGSKTTGS